ncbi:DnaJ domain [Trypanosoma vivax]|uniref:Putative chaperone DNAJ-like protein n=1 Tax=Trypanosoma vivax (strain Y486) TaxID=1055687 RepID=G0U3N1_TRYVY|nr:putative chaperone DNAJ-like protein [Trypanosoma vivax]KAH8613551.1 DnaJ domain [Trypanosoma vivax]CCC50888.1 putative chaperone DNAJ-like protein [Trypanosoma vivax Y486]
MNEARIDQILENRKSYYEVLNVPRNADERTIRRVYRALALQLHPDKNINNEKANEAFCVVRRAYDILSDEWLRSVYDSYGEEGLFYCENVHGPTFTELVAIALLLLYEKLRAFIRYRGRFIRMLLNDPSWTSKPIFTMPHPFSKTKSKSKSKQTLSGPTAGKLFNIYLLLAACLVLCSGAFSIFVTFNGGKVATDTHTWLFARERFKGYTSAFVYQPPNGAGTRGVTVWHPPGLSEVEARKLVRQWVHEVCPVERLLAWASQERFAPSATMRVGRPLKAAPSPNRMAKRRWPRRHWRPKFTETFSVESADQLFALSPLCV